jgi:hypothetical protein
MDETKPTGPSAPWWATLIAVVLTAAVSVMGTVYALGSGPKVPGAPAGVSSLVGDTITYIPHIMLLFGVLADMFTYEGVYSIPSLVGILSIFGNWILRFFWRGLGAILEKTKVIATEASSTDKTVPVRGAFVSATKPPTPAESRKLLGQKGGADAGIATEAKRFFQDYDGCNVQGFSGWASSYAPQTLVVSATIFMYYLFDIVSNRGWLNALAGILFFSIVFVGQSYVIGACKPVGAEKPFTSTQQALMALVEGMLMGGLSYTVVAAYYPTRLPSSVISPFPRKSRADLTMGPDGSYVDSEGNPYVILPNGQAVPDLSDAESRKKFADIAGQNLGTGTTAVPGSCSS